MENQYNDRHAREILEPYASAGYLSFDELGVWPGDKLKMQDKHDEFESSEPMSPETEALRWRPADHLQHLPDATEPASTPMLPNPFNARELAAFMLGGTGAQVRHEYGEWADGPDQQSLSRIDRQSYARRAVIEAFAAYREAERVVGAYPTELAAVADRARKAYNIANMEANLREGVSDSIPGTEDSRVRRERAKSSIAALDSEMEAANKAAQIASETWLTAMVVCLLVEQKPQAATVKPGINKKWTPEFTNEVRVYRTSYTEAQTAEKYGVSGSLIRRKLAATTPASKSKATPFSGLVHRSK